MRDPDFISNSAATILTQVMNALQNAEELGGTADTEDYLNLMHQVATLAVHLHNTANSERTDGEVRPDLSVVLA